MAPVYIWKNLVCSKFARKGTDARENKHLVSTNGKAQSIPLIYIKEKNYEMTQFCGVIAEKNYLYMKKENEERKNG